MILTLRRVLSDDQGTLGELCLDGRRVCWTIELPWRDNATGRSCVPAGLYRVTYLDRSASGRWRDVYHVHGVPKRVGILIHSGNLAGDRSLGFRAQSAGCILPGLSRGAIKGQRAVLNSMSAMAAIHELTGRAGFNLEIVGV